MLGPIMTSRWLSYAETLRLLKSIFGWWCEEHVFFQRTCFFFCFYCNSFYKQFHLSGSYFYLFFFYMYYNSGSLILLVLPKEQKNSPWRWTEQFTLNVNKTEQNSSHWHWKVQFALTLNRTTEHKIRKYYQK